MKRGSHVSVVAIFRFLPLVTALALFPALCRAGVITGEIRDENGSLIEEPIRVTASSQQWLSCQSENGVYRIENLREGYYWIQTQGVNSDTWYPSVWYPNQVITEFADQVFIPANEIIEFDMTLRPGGRISGSAVPAEGGNFGQRGVSLECYYIAPEWGWRGFSFDVDNPAACQSGALPAGDYHIRFNPTGNDDLHVPSYYGNTWNPADAEIVVIAPRQWNRNINVALPVGGGISGAVRGQFGLLSDAEVTGVAAVEEDEWEGLWSGMTDMNGDYFIGGVPPDVDCYLQFDGPPDQNYVKEYYDDVYEIEAATPLRVRSGEILRGFDAQLLPGVSLFGNIHGPDGSVPQRLDVKVYQSLGPDIDQDELTINPQQNGSWTIGSGLPPGIYTFEFNPSGAYPYWQKTYAGGAIFPWQADWSKWWAGEQAGPYNINLAWAGQIEGIITDPNGNPVPDASIFLLSGQYVYDEARVGDEGDYSLSNIPPGRYTLIALPSGGDGIDIDRPWSATFYPNAGSFGQAESFAVNARETIQINVQLLRGGVLHTLITDPQGGFYEEADNVMILSLALNRSAERNIWAPSSAEDGPPMAGPEGFDLVLPPGEFTLMGLPMYVGANPGGATPSVRRTFYGGGFDFEGAQFFQITAGQLTEIEMTMAETGRTVSGTIRSAVDNRIPAQFMLTTDERGNYSGIYFPFEVNQASAYFIQGLPPGQFYVTAVPFSGSGDFGESHLVTTWHPNCADPGSIPIFNFQMTPPPQGAQALQMGNADLRDVDVVMQPVEHYNSVGDDSGTPSAPPSGFELHGAYPNPFNDATVISFALSTRTFVRLSVFNLLGRKVREVLAEPLDAGSHKVPFKGGGLATGVYFIQMQSGGYEATAPLILMK